MLSKVNQVNTSLGADLRALRRARGLTLQHLAAQMGRSVGWISQVERNLSLASISDLKAFANAFSVPLSLFFGQAEAPDFEAGYVVRKDARRRIGSGEGGLIEEMLSPDLTDAFEMVHSVFQAGAALDAPVIRPTQEVGYVVSGRLDLNIGGRNFTIDAGDSFRIRGEAYLWANPYDEPAVVIWVIAPPVY